MIDWEARNTEEYESLRQREHLISEKHPDEDN
jgi:hypothetical protein